MIVGLAVMIGMFMGSEILNFILIGSLLYCACFIYASPIDLETCRACNKNIDHTMSPWRMNVLRSKGHSVQIFNSRTNSLNKCQANPATEKLI